ncbi:MAG: Fe-S-containing hydro-lyase [Chloroflexi bacterium]|nr:Fe-S-containing hydro-lyase [Chloroflexota bacterium]MCL5074808.1 Fe-S-containing hydro-lyase [Chloroflexota bacterium]
MKISAPFTEEAVCNLKVGDAVEISGTLYAARDAAHKRLVSALENGHPLPFDPQGAVIYYVGPTPAKPGQVIGSAGPTTSYRMDPYAIPLLAAGVRGMIGKGGRSPEVKAALQRYKAIYLAAIGGAAALIAKTIKAAEVIAYEELGPEALLRLSVKDFPAVVVNDIYGGDLYERGKQQWASPSEPSSGLRG